MRSWIVRDHQECRQASRKRLAKYAQKNVKRGLEARKVIWVGRCTALVAHRLFPAGNGRQCLRKALQEAHHALIGGTYTRWALPLANVRYAVNKSPDGEHNGGSWRDPLWVVRETHATDTDRHALSFM